MANILCFDKELPETGTKEYDAPIKTFLLDDQTYEVVESPIVNVERDDENNITLYFNETPTRKIWYITITQEELDLIKQVE